MTILTGHDRSIDRGHGSAASGNLCPHIAAAFAWRSEHPREASKAPRDGILAELAKYESRD